MKNLTKGSEWNKWDFHIHTPSSFLNNEFGNDWDKYVSTLFKKAIEKNIKTIGITDYFTIDGYKKIKSDYLSKEEKLQELFSEEEIKLIKEILIIPNIEFRLTQLVNGNRVNFHVIFSDKVSIKDIEENFLHELEFAYEGRIQEEDEWWKLKVSNLSEFGKKLKEEHPNFKDKSDIFIGMKCAVVNDKDITSILNGKKSKFKDKYIIVTPSDEDLSEVSWDGQGHNIRKVLIQKSDALFASNSNTIKWGLGKYGEKEDYIKEFKSLKPAIWGSDSHTYDSLFEPSNKRFCWIKANNTFEGLRQVIFEPEDRVYIGEAMPDQKNSYQIIKEVRFMDENFSSEIIPLNSNLVTIIGGKSTGKSLLLRNIARTIDSKEVEKRLLEGKIIDYNKSIERFEVIWNDGQNQQSDERDSFKKIIYIPQSYLNRLVDSPQDNNSIDEIIVNVLKQEKEVEAIFDEIESFERDNQRKISTEIEEIFFLIEDIKKQNEKIKVVGDEKGIEEVLNQLKIEIKDLKSKSGLTTSENELFNSVASKIASNKEVIERNKNDIQKIEELLKAKIFNDLKLDSLTEEIKNNLTESISVLQKQYLESFKNILSPIKISLEESNKKLTKENSNEKEKVNLIIDKLKSSKILNTKIEKEKEEKGKLKLIKEYQEAKKLFSKDLNDKIQKLKSLHKEYFKKLMTSRDKILSNHTIDSDLEFGININFRSNHFKSNFIENILNQKYLSKIDNVNLVEYEYKTNTDFENDIEKIMISLFGNKIILKKNFSNKDALVKLLENWYLYDFQIKQNGDNISDMSPGKKSFVLLKLLIELDNSECPILLDQPEDDLDNRSIYKDLVSFIRTKKKNRQIIIATHNPNLVVGSDSEQVIVANQHGDKSPNEKYKFEYVSGGLENTYKLTTENLSTLKKQGIQEHVCDILEGGRIAFEKRKNKYNLN